MTTDTVASSSLLKNVTRYEDVKDAAKKTSEDMGKQDFLTLFTAQLQNQNPLEPVKNEAFVAQLAQFSQLEATTQGTLYGAYNAVNGYFQNVRNYKDEESKFKSIMYGTALQRGQTSFNLCTDFAQFGKEALN